MGMFDLPMEEKIKDIMIQQSYAYSIELYLGEKRSGKTLSMIAQTREEIKQNPLIPVYANMHLNKKYFPNFHFITKEDLVNFFENEKEFTKAIFLVDEIQILMDSRQFGKKSSQAISYFLGQMGKRENIFRGTTHFLHLVDYRLRDYCEKKNFCRKGFVINGKFSPILNNNFKLTDEENEELVIQIKPLVRKMVDYNFYDVSEQPIYIKASDYFDLYDTKELIYEGKKEIKEKKEEL